MGGRGYCEAILFRRLLLTSNQYLDSIACESGAASKAQQELRPPVAPACWPKRVQWCLEVLRHLNVSKTA